MGIFSRLFKIGQAEANAAIDKLEDPIKMTEQGIKDMKKDLDKSLQALAEVKALAIRSKSEMNQAKNQAESYEHKAMLLLKKAENGQLDANEADRLASEALVKKQEAETTMTRSKTEIESFDKNITNLEQNIKKLKSQISHYENELKTLKARAKVSNATKKINKSMSQIDSSGTVAMLEKMKDKVAQDEAMAEAYGEIAGENKSLDEEIDSALDDPSLKASDALAELKAKMNKNK